MSDDDPRITRRTTIKGALSAAAAAGVGAGALAYTPDGATAETEGGIDAEDITVESPGGDLETLSIEPILFTEVSNIDEEDIEPDSSEAWVSSLTYEQVEGRSDEETYEDPETDSGEFLETGNDPDSTQDGEVIFDWGDSGPADLLSVKTLDEEGNPDKEFDPEFLEPESEEDELETEITVDIEIDIREGDGEEDTLVIDEISTTFALIVSDATAGAEVNIVGDSSLGASGE